MHAADLHNHTTASDGDFSPTELVTRYRALGVRAIAVTDHDTLNGLREAMAAGANEGVEVLPGVEVTLRFSEPLFVGSLHLLLYFRPQLLEDESFLAHAAETFGRGRGDFLVRARLEALNRWFAPGGEEPRLPRAMVADDLYSQASQVSRRHFAVALERMGISSPEERTRIIGNDSPAYIPSGMTFEDLAPLLGAWPLVRVLAHPAAGSFPGDSHYKEVLPPIEVVEQLLPRFLEMGLDGLEVAYPGHTAELSARVASLVEAHGLSLATGGSDCHDEAMRPPGTSGVGYEVVEQILERLPLSD